MKGPFFETQLITYIGNKRALLPFINSGIEKVKAELGKDKLRCLDGFAGSGVVSRLLKSHASYLLVNDLELYSYVVNRCYLSNKSEIDTEHIAKTISKLNQSAKNNLTRGFISEHYAPKDDNNIKSGERVFYTTYNAQMIDTLRQLVFSTVPEAQRVYYLAPLLVAASVHTNTSGVFKGFHKKDGRGHFGGRGESARQRIMKPIELQIPIFGDSECPVEVVQRDINELVRSERKFDLAYFDPPYNQHPYGSNYFMLNLIAGCGDDVPIQEGVSGIARDWNRSAYNKRVQAVGAMDDLIRNTKAKYILVSYNNEGIIPMEQFKKILGKYGKYELLEQEYNTYRGSRNLGQRSSKVKEYLWLLKKEK